MKEDPFVRLSKFMYAPSETAAKYLLGIVISSLLQRNIPYKLGRYTEKGDGGLFCVFAERKGLRKSGVDLVWLERFDSEDAMHTHAQIEIMEAKE